MPSALKLVGDRYQLQERQRLAVMRSSCSDSALRRRESTRQSGESLVGCHLVLDGYNVLTSVEAALGDGVILKCRDGCYRDMASMHGTYRKVAETIPALKLIGDYLQSVGAAGCTWYLDSPVSNSGRLKTILNETAAGMNWNWQVELVQSPDTLLANSAECIATADSAILDRCQKWLNLAREVIERRVPEAWIVDLSGRADR